MKNETQLEISPKDTMYEGNLQHYIGVGQSALRCVRTAMAAADKSTVRNILDFACGFGRVLRIFKSVFPEAELTACDISPDAIDFCANAFGAAPVLSSENPAEVQFKDKFDLIWCGSLFTHLEAVPFLKLLERLRSLLSVDGLLVFTTHGPFVARRVPEEAFYGLDEKSVVTLLNGYNSSGFGYVDYPSEVLPQVGVVKYGFSVSKPSWVCRQIESIPDVRLINYCERAWDNHQDSVACMNQ